MPVFKAQERKVKVKGTEERKEANLLRKCREKYI
jgi:hypothetical protein